jgi:hypothetical protein
MKFRNPWLQRSIAFRRLDRETLTHIASQNYFPIELLDCLDDFLESKLLEILVKHGAEKVTVQMDLVPCESTARLKILIHDRVLNPIYLTDDFMGEYFDRIEQGMNEKQLKFYDKLLSKLS